MLPLPNNCLESLRKFHKNLRHSPFFFKQSLLQVFAEGSSVIGSRGQSFQTILSILCWGKISRIIERKSARCYTFLFKLWRLTLIILRGCCSSGEMRERGEDCPMNPLLGLYTFAMPRPATAGHGQGPAASAIGPARPSARRPDQAHVASATVRGSVRTSQKLGLRTRTIATPVGRPSPNLTRPSNPYPEGLR